MKALRLFLLVMVAIALSGCANNYAKFYQGEQDARLRTDYDATVQGVRIVRTDDFAASRLDLLRQSFVPIGSAGFQANASAVREDQAIEVAQKIGAHVVVLASKHLHTQNTVMPLTTPNTTTSYTTGQATAYNAYGVTNAYGSATTTTYGSKTTYIPVSITTNSYGAEFYAKVRPRVGLIVVDLDEAVRKRLGSNQGVSVMVVADNTPGFYADVLPGDVVATINDEPVYGRQGYGDLIAKYAGRRTVFGLLRDGVSIRKEIEIRN